MIYVVITMEFALANQNHISGVNQFGFAVLNDGRYVCSENSLQDFPELFKGTDFPLAEIDNNLFVRNETD